MNFREYQEAALKTDLAPKDIAVALLGLAGEVGSLLTEFKKDIREGDRYRLFTDSVAEEIGDILWYLANIASKQNLDLNEIAEDNITKLEERWAARPPGGERHTATAPQYDRDFPESEQLPRRFRVTFVEKRIAQGKQLSLTLDGKPLGDPLTDNSHIDDGYRYHDVFHLCYTALLGWSPVVRKLLGVKRKSDPQMDEVEDGARAAVTEEAISALVFSHARKFSFFDGSESVDYALLRTIRELTAPFEVRDRSPREWERAILSSYAVWRELRARAGGVLVADADAADVRFEPLPEANESGTEE